MTRIDETYIQFQIDDYPSPVDDRCVVVFTTEARADYLLSCARFGHYVSTRWYRNDGGNLDDFDLEFIDTFINLVERDLIMGCELTAFEKMAAVLAGEEYEGVDYSANGNVARIAIALESLDEKTPEFVSLQDLLDDLDGNFASAALSEFVPIFELLTVLGNLFPSLAFKIDATSLIGKVWEYFTWRAPVLGLLTTMDMSLAGMALGALGSGASAFLQLLGSGSEAAAKLWWQTINGAGNFFGWWDSLYDWWHGNSSEPEPTDEEKWATAKIFNDVFVEGDAVNVNVANNVSCGCGCGGSGHIEPTPAEIGQDAPDGYEWPDTGEVDEYECKAAHFVFNEILDLMTKFRDNDVDNYAVLPVVAVGAIVTALTATGPIGWTIGIVSTVVTYLVVSTTVDFANVVTQLQASKDDIICAILGQEPEAAEIALLGEMSLGTVEEGLLKLIMTNHLMNLLIVKEAAFYSTIMALDVECSACESGCENFIVHTGTELVYQSQYRSVLLSGFRHAVTLFFDVEFAGGPICGNGITVNNVTVDSGTVYSTGGGAWRFWDNTGALVYASNTPPTFPLDNITQMYLYNGDTAATQFTITIDWSN